MIPDPTPVLEPPDDLPVGPCSMCIHTGEDHAEDGTCDQCSCPGYVEYTREMWEADAADIEYSCYVEGADR